MTFAHPENLAFFALLALLVATWIGYGLWYQRVRNRAGDGPLIDAMTASVNRRAAFLRRLMQIAGVALIILAIARPQWGMTDEYVEEEALDVVFAVDLSNSMLAEDAPPNRLQAAEQALSETMAHMTSDRVGLVIFTSISFVQSPLTNDYSTIEFFLDRLHPDQIPVGGTNIGAAIQDATQFLGGRRHRDDERNEMPRADEQVIVLLTDGEDHESSPSTAADQAREAGIRIVTIGIGGPDGSPVPEFDDQGNRIGWVQEDGQQVMTRLDEETLRDVARRTDGTYIHFQSPRQTAGELIDTLDTFERTAVDERITEQYIDRFMWFLIPGFALLLISLMIRRRRRTTEGWRRLIPFAAVLTLLLTPGCDVSFERSFAEAEQVNESIAQGDYEGALEVLDELEPEYGDRGEYQFNRGRAHLGLEQYDRARSAFADALASDNPDLRADAHYHLGIVDAEVENWQAARDHFQRGLREFIGDDGAQDGDLQWDLKRNLEIALHHLFPPCAQFEDDFEPNASADEAAELDAFSVPDLTLCAERDDYFALPAITGSTITVEASFQQLRDEPDPEHTFLPDPADLTLALVAPDGATVLDVDDGTPTDDEDLRRQNDQHRTERRIDSFELGDDILDAGQPNALFIVARAAEGLEFSYDLQIDYDAPCRALDDEFEPNSTADDAADLDAGEHNLRMCADDEDWFRLRPDYGDSIFVDLYPQTDQFDDQAPELEFELMRADTQEVVSTGQLDGQALTAGIDDVDFGTDLLMRVRGVDDEQTGPYSVEVHHFQPCPEGTDRFAPNDTPRQASRLDPEEVEHRYLRLCDGDTDYHIAPVGEEGTVEWSLRTLPEDPWRYDFERADSDLPFGNFPLMQLDLLRADGSVHASAKEVSVDNDDQGDESVQRTSLTDNQHLLVDDPPDDESALLRVDGDAGFYHLTQPADGDSDSEDEQDEDQQDEDEQQDEQQDEDDQDDSDEQQQDQQDEQQDQDEDDDQQQEDGDDDGEEDGEDDADQQEQDQDQQPPDESAEISPEEMDDVLRSLEAMDENFQLQRAIEEAPTRQPMQEW